MEKKRRIHDSKLVAAASANPKTGSGGGVKINVCAVCIECIYSAFSSLCLTHYPLASFIHFFAHKTQCSASSIEGNCTDEEGYFPEKVVKTRRRGGQLEFLVKWHGFHESNNTWEPREHLVDTGVCKYQCLAFLPSSLLLKYRTLHIDMK